jgi:hypothetical protein
MWYATLVCTKRNLSKAMHNIVISLALVQQPLARGMMLLIYYSFSMFSALSIHPSVACNILTNSYVSSSGIALCNVCSEIYCVQFGHLASAWGTPVFYRCTVESILTWNWTSDKTRNFSTQTQPFMHTNNRRWSTRWSLSLWSVHCSLRPLCSGKEHPRSRTVSRQYDVAASIVAISTHCCTQRSTAVVTSEVLHPQSEIIAKCFGVTAFSSLKPLQTCQQDNVM